MKTEEPQRPFWIQNGRPGASEAELDRAEAILGRRLPAEYRVALLRQDGGVSIYSGFRRGEYYVPVPAFFSVALLLAAEDARDEFATPAGIVAIASGAHNWLGLDYRSSGEPTVVYQDSEEREIESVARSFSDFVGGLVED